MSRNRTRLERLERQQPRQFLTVFEDGGVMWIPGDKDYRRTLAPGPGDRLVTGEELQALEREYLVLLVRWIPMYGEVEYEQE